jgi:hypothetical protein
LEETPCSPGCLERSSKLLMGSSIPL